MHRTTDRFWKSFDNLPATVQKIARQNFQLLRENPWHPSLHFKKVGQFWSARVGINHHGYWRLRMLTITFGFGLVRMTNMNE